ncbi:MAG: hypothetical protein AAF098_15665 [Pseudomonadota bacterium]
MSEGISSTIFPVATICLPPASEAAGAAIVFGFPLPESWCTNPRDLQLTTKGGTIIPAHLESAALWSDRSIRWCKAHCRPNFQGGDQLTIGVRRRTESAPSVEEDYLGFLRTDELIHLATERFLFQVPKRDSEILKVLNTDGLPILDISFSLCIGQQKHEAIISSSSHQTFLGEGQTISFEITLSGHWNIDQGFDIEFDCKLLVAPTGKRIDGDVRIHNAESALHAEGLWDLGDRNSLSFSALELGILCSGGNPSAPLGRVQVSPEDPFISFDHEFTLTQHGSGGTNWDSPNHSGAGGELLPQKPGYVLTHDGQRKTGLRSNPIGYLSTLVTDEKFPDNFELGVYLDRFWEEFPSAIIANENGLVIQPFAETGVSHELQPGEAKSRSFQIYLAEETRPAETRPASRLTFTLDPAHVHLCAPPELGAVSSIDLRIQELTNIGLDDTAGFKAKRELIDEFGWRNFGDLYADHETANHHGTELFISHYNNQYDPTFGFLRRFLLDGDEKWMELADDLSRHVVDIDIYQTTKDRPEYNNGLFWHTDHYLPAELSTHRSYSRLQALNAYEGHAHGGGPGGQHCYTTGLLLHYLLTGHEPSRSALYQLRSWIETVYEGTGTLTDIALALRNRKRRDLKDHLTQRYPLDRGVANYLNALMDCYLLDQRPSTLKQIEYIIQNTLHPSDDVSAKGLEQVEDNWYYVVFLQALARYLELKSQFDRLDEPFSYARDSLITYAQWMLEHETPYLDKPEILEFPNLTWAAQDLRKANILFAAARWSSASSDAFEQRATEFVDYVLNTLKDEHTLRYTRIQALLLQNLCPSTAAPRVASIGTATDREWGKPPAPGLFRQSQRLFLLMWRAIVRLDVSKELLYVKTVFRKREGEPFDG